MDSISFWLLALVMPLVIVGFNGFVRALAKLPQSLAADIALALILFDAVVVANPTVFENYVRNSELKHSLIAIFVLMIILGMMFWALIVFVSEKLIDEYNHNKRVFICAQHGCKFNPDGKKIKFPLLGYFLSFFVPVVQLFGNISPFAVG